MFLAYITPAPLDYEATHDILAPSECAKEFTFTLMNDRILPSFREISCNLPPWNG